MWCRKFPFKHTIRPTGSGKSPEPVSVCFLQVLSFYPAPGGASTFPSPNAIAYWVCFQFDKPPGTCYTFECIGISMMSLFSRFSRFPGSLSAGNPYQERILKHGNTQDRWPRDPGSRQQHRAGSCPGSRRQNPHPLQPQRHQPNRRMPHVFGGRCQIRQAAGFLCPACFRGDGYHHQFPQGPQCPPGGVGADPVRPRPQLPDL